MTAVRLYSKSRFLFQHGDSDWPCVGQVLFSTDELKKRVGIPTKAEWAARYKVAPVDGPLPPGVPEYDPLLGAGQYSSEALLAPMHLCPAVNLVYWLASCFFAMCADKYSI